MNYMSGYLLYHILLYSLVYLYIILVNDHTPTEYSSIYIKTSCINTTTSNPINKNPETDSRDEVRLNSSIESELNPIPEMKSD